MTNKELEERFYKIGVIPVIALDDAKDASPMGDALMKGGLPAAEVTFRTAAAVDTIKILKKEFPDMLVGAGTVLTTEQADRAIDAGAEFIVAPGLNPKVVKHVLDKGYHMSPGIATATEIEAALDLGLTFVKFFPAEANGGLPMIKALAGPYTNVKYMPTGGVNAKNLADYLSYDKIVCCGGTWVVKKDLVSEGKFSEIEKMAKEAADIVKQYHN
ncbi:MAG: bifunctional 4-hydroxy-2-oxoglutarate aldolase/2-dehydro-3-deoxy-phosphogluconate aldolase [Lachnospiraceae bacterium]|nr:bifunctional 4-hydroxy-2-oxoglutarate aldolase/2-dehydro-3-deoxy-phosphogluconate aldolase [Lachnospiraceae bacterium]